jgi:hypothetical protein
LGGKGPRERRIQRINDWSILPRRLQMTTGDHGRKENVRKSWIPGDPIGGRTLGQGSERMRLRKMTLRRNRSRTRKFKIHGPRMRNCELELII